jgi:hypothetical protein
MGAPSLRRTSMEMEKMKSFTAGFQEIMTETVPTSRFFLLAKMDTFLE